MSTLLLSLGLPFVLYRSVYAMYRVKDVFPAAPTLHMLITSNVPPQLLFNTLTGADPHWLPRVDSEGYEWPDRRSRRRQEAWHIDGTVVNDEDVFGDG